MMNLHPDTESENTDYDEDALVDKYSLSFMCLKEADAFKRRFIDLGKPQPKHPNYLSESITVDLDYMDTDYCESPNLTYQPENPIYSWQKKWDGMTELLEDKYEDSFEMLVMHYTVILQFHLEQRVDLSSKYYGIMFYCDSPNIIKQIFDADLFESNIKNTNGNFSLFVHRFFHDDFLENIALHSDSAHLLFTYTIIFYRFPIVKLKDKIIKWVGLLGEYFTKENEEEMSVSGLNPVIAYTAVVNSLIDNGLFTHKTLDKFLESSKIKRILDDDDSEMDDSDTSFSDISDISEMNGNIHLQVNRAHARPNQPAKESLKNRINFQNKSMFPSSLKNLCRIKIKQTMPNYTKKTVYRLSILPKALKEFVLFNDQIDPIIKKVRMADAKISL